MPSSKVRFNQADLKKSRNNRRSMFLVAFTILVIAMVMAMTATFSASRFIFQQISSQGSDTLADATWMIDQATVSGDGTFTLRMMSSIGNLRTYTGVRSYGLSNSGRILALSTDATFQLINLADDSATEFLLPFAYSGDYGEAITWSPNDDNFAFVVSNETDSLGATLVIMDADGEVVQEVQDLFASYSINGETKFFPAVFSPTNKLILTRTYEDTSLPVERDPAVLKVFNLAGSVRKEISLRDGVPTEDQISYMWNAAGDTVLYRIDPLDTSINFAKEFEFTSAFIGY